ncbi:MAG: 50S ribosomal protein L23 [Acidobacteria bacterium]|nr:50S ribosomal protein L23 [Acidobacteriota bacterium]
MKKSAHLILRKPIITEKSVDLKDRARTLCFEVDRDANKREIMEAVEEMFVELRDKIESVHTASFHGKVRRRGWTSGRRPDWKKAYVKLRAGTKVPEYAETV